MCALTCATCALQEQRSASTAVTLCGVTHRTYTRGRSPAGLAVSILRSVRELGLQRDCTAPPQRRENPQCRYIDVRRSPSPILFVGTMRRASILAVLALLAPAALANPSQGEAAASLAATARDASSILSAAAASLARSSPSQGSLPPAAAPAPAAAAAALPAAGARSALIVVDTQPCFMEGGSLAVAGGADIVPVVNALLANSSVPWWVPVGGCAWACRARGAQLLCKGARATAPTAPPPAACLQGPGDLHAGLAPASAHLLCVHLRARGSQGIFGERRAPGRPAPPVPLAAGWPSASRGPARRHGHDACCAPPALPRRRT